MAMALAQVTQRTNSLKKVFNSSLCQWLFARVHPNAGIGIAAYWSRKSRINSLQREEKFLGEEREFLWVYCNEIEKKMHHDFYVFGHRHLPLDLAINACSRYINLGEWVHFNSYAVYDGEDIVLENFSPA